MTCTSVLPTLVQLMARRPSGEVALLLAASAGLLVPAAGQILPAVTDREAVGKRRVVAAAVGEGVPEMRWPPEQEHQ